MISFWPLLAEVLQNFIVGFLLRQLILKLILFGTIFVFLFVILPLLVQLIVPAPLLNALSYYVQMLQGNTWGEQITFILIWWQFPQLLEVFLPAFIASWLFRRI